VRYALPHLLALAVVASVQPASAAARSAPVGEPLYFAVDVWQEGRLLAHPRLLGEAGKPLRVERRHPGAALPDYRFSLMPIRRGGGYQVDFALKLPGAEARSELAVSPGQVRQLELGDKPGALRVSLLVMRVNSPEFRALMDGVGERPGAGARGDM
jgi:hypothetical protein